jgi:hypothetical protein
MADSTPVTFPLLVTEAEATILHGLLEAFAPLVSAEAPSATAFADAEIQKGETALEAFITQKYGAMVEGLAAPVLDNLKAQLEGFIAAKVAAAVALVQKDAAGS